MSVTVPDGWYGGGSATGLGVGQGNDEVNQRFAGGGFFVDVIPMRYGAAVAAFAKLQGLTFEGEPQVGALDGRQTTTFRAHPRGDHVVLDPIAPGLDISSAHGRQMFIDADGSTLLIRTELNAASFESQLDEVLASLAFA
jgi:hypothetical protein